MSVREMLLSEVTIRVDYFLNASDEYLLELGVDRTALPSRADWLSFYEEDYRRPIRERINYSLVWELDDEIVGFSTTDRIDFGSEAFMHLHITDPSRRQRGFGVEFVRRSARTYFEVLDLQRLYCEPNALNVAPNRTLQKAGFHYLFSHQAQPSPINYPQVTTRWVIERGDLDGLGDSANPHHLESRSRRTAPAS
jgi:RimJ/RimL family protein N-acetyltransferase